MRSLFRCFLFAAGCLAAAAQAASVSAVVSHVSDGDTVWVRVAGRGAPRSVRLLHVDAPERCQRHGPAARQALQARLARERVTLHTRGRDSYQRLLARVEHRGDDVGAWLVRQGHAWSDRYRNRPGPYARHEAEARGARRGLWAEARPQRPREFRRQHGRCPR